MATILPLLATVVGRGACRHLQQFVPAVSTLVQPLQQLVQTAVVPADVLRVAKTRGFHSSGTLLSSSSTLSAILGKELKHEKTTYEKDEVVEAGPPAPFVLHSTMGDTAISLTRDHKGEKISVDCSVNLQDSVNSLPSEFGEGEEDEAAAEETTDDVNFNVTVTKDDKALVFECVSDGSYLDIRHISLEPAGGLDSETAYTGPVFAELDEDLQNAFREYITERGINEDLGEYLRHLMYDKELKEYQHWLSSVKDFAA